MLREAKCGSFKKHQIVKWDFPGISCEDIHVRAYDEYHVIYLSIRESLLISALYIVLEVWVCNSLFILLLSAKITINEHPTTRYTVPIRNSKLLTVPIR